MATLEKSPPSRDLQVPSASRPELLGGAVRVRSQHALLPPKRECGFFQRAASSCLLLQRCSASVLASVRAGHAPTRRQAATPHKHSRADCGAAVARRFGCHGHDGGQGCTWGLCISVRMSTGAACCMLYGDDPLLRLAALAGGPAAGSGGAEPAPAAAGRQGAAAGVQGAAGGAQHRDRRQRKRGIWRRGRWVGLSPACPDPSRLFSPCLPAQAAMLSTLLPCPQPTTPAARRPP